jgi:hypothetical protein
MIFLSTLAKLVLGDPNLGMIFLSALTQLVLGDPGTLTTRG